MENKKSFFYVFQITKLIIFEVHYYKLGNNDNKYMSTSANEFIKSKKDYSRCGQAQKDLLKNTKAAMEFFKKWDVLHCKDLTDIEYIEILKDIEVLKNKYNYIEKIDSDRDFSFSKIVDFSKQALK